MIWPLGFAACQSKNRSGFYVLHTITSNNSFASAKVYLHNFIEPTKDKSGMGNLTKPNDYSVKFVKKHKYKAN